MSMKKRCFFIPGWAFSEAIYAPLRLPSWEWIVPAVWNCITTQDIEKTVHEAFCSSGATIVVGYSLGSMLAIDLAARFAVSHLVLIAPTACFTRDDGHGFHRRILERMKTKLTISPRGVLEEFATRCFSPQEKENAKNLLTRGDEYFLEPFSPFLRSGLEALIQWDKRDLLGLIQAPVWILRGESDQICLPAMSEEIKRALPQVKEYCYQGVGHLPFWSSKECIQDWKNLFHHIEEKT